jgi:hypothetical protein
LTSRRLQRKPVLVGRSADKDEGDAESEEDEVPLTNASDAEDADEESIKESISAAEDSCESPGREGVDAMERDDEKTASDASETKEDQPLRKSGKQNLVNVKMEEEEEDDDEGERGEADYEEEDDEEEFSIANKRKRQIKDNQGEENPGDSAWLIPSLLTRSQCRQAQGKQEEALLRRQKGALGSTVGGKVPRACQVCSSLHAAP